MTTPDAMAPDAIGLLLAELLSESPEQTTEREHGLYDRMSAPFPSRVVIFGAGQLGRFILPALRKSGIEPVAYCDNNQIIWGSEIEGVPVLRPADAMAEYGESASFLTALYNSSPIHRQLTELGCKRIVPYPAFFWKYWKNLPGEERLELPHRILDQAAHIPAAYHLLDDDRSREEFLTQLRWRCLLDYDCLPKNDPPQEMYYARDLIALTPDEVLVDCGAFDGDSMQSFLEKTGGNFRHIFLFEPDPANQRALAARIAGYSPEVAARITTYPYALGSENGVVRFSADGDVGSKVVADGGTVELECRTLDTMLGDAPCPTFIKMDIEGAEVQAIPGGAGVIGRCRPILAVCAYHRCDHLWIIPQLLKQALPDCHIFLRRYAEECWETVYYAVPTERLTGDTGTLNRIRQ